MIENSEKKNPYIDVWVSGSSSDLRFASNIEERDYEFFFALEPVWTIPFVLSSNSYLSFGSNSKELSISFACYIMGRIIQTPF